MNYTNYVLDCLILGILQKDPLCTTTYISQTLKLPKSAVVNRIRFLYELGYVQFRENGFFVTNIGDRYALSPEKISPSEDNYEQEADEPFSWENCGYIPTPDSFRRKKRQKRN